MALCDCGNSTGRLVMKATAPDGKALPAEQWKWICPACSPADFKAERFGSAPDKKLWLMQDVTPNEYEWRGGQHVLKDWAQSDLEASFAKEDPDDVAMREAAKARKRQQAREVRMVHGSQLSPAQVTKIDEDIKAIRQEESAKAAGLVLPA